MRYYYVEFSSRISGGSDAAWIYAGSEEEALRIARTKINTHKLVPDYLNNYSRWMVT